MLYEINQMPTELNIHLKIMPIPSKRSKNDELAAL